MNATHYLKVLLCFFILNLPGWSGADEPGTGDINPDPKYSPAEVVSLQMNALKNNDTPYKDAGIELTFRFASPENKKSTGPIERFKLLFDNEDYAPMLNHSSMKIGPINYSEDSANVPIFILSKEGKKVLYIFQLDKQAEKPYKNCWMTSGVIRVPTEWLEGPENKPV